MATKNCLTLGNNYQKARKNGDIWDAPKLLSESYFCPWKILWRARWDLNPGSSAPEADALIRARLQAHVGMIVTER